ncbi:MAG TPA: hypothetical protein VFO10_17735 [Oligoflexus sp.]|uniref:hypothetical protein n=1 Tax=Oligoflexus sp. TaxID=1971216 RepID=UPI002D80C4C2|nr:hypothetical protein [Oligoflexus sp.]HET9239105.1 hypothetical protein [Oligoflexus sp.]
MKKLRAIQERRGSETFPNDLRGVGESPLLTELPPCPYLVVRGSDLPTLEPIEKLFELQVNPQDQVFILESAVNESHKHKALRLWFVARFLLKQHPGLELQIGERDLLREALLANIGQTEFVHPNRQQREPVPVQLHGSGSLTLSVLLQHVLVQVGYPIQATEQDCILSADDELFRFEFPIETRKALAV